MFQTCWYMFCRFVWNSILLKLKKYVAKYVLVLSTVSPSKYLTIYWGCRRYSGVLFMLAEKVINSKNISDWWRRNMVYWIWLVSGDFAYVTRILHYKLCVFIISWKLFCFEEVHSPRETPGEFRSRCKYHRLLQL